jgi:cytochrome b561
MASLIAGNSDTDTTSNDHAVTQKVVHWLMALAIMLDLFIA